MAEYLLFYGMKTSYLKGEIGPAKVDIYKLLKYFPNTGLSQNNLGNYFFKHGNYLS
ncbi:MAG: hypothetical protein KDC83_13775 [Flavobacteriales bacterium]|nr:hypothetical protein [Flavobacteriales bacterium]